MNTTASGGQIAIRGFIVQTLVALLGVVQAEPPFISITLEPNEAHEQFDFVWQADNGRYAVQVKSSINQFTQPVVTGYANALQAARSNEECKLILLGNFHSKMAGKVKIGDVAIVQKNLDLAGLANEAAHLLGKFMESHGQHAGSAAQRELGVNSLMGALLQAGTQGRAIRRAEFIRFVINCLGRAPQHGAPVDISRIVKYAPPQLIGRSAETQLLVDAWDAVLQGTQSPSSTQSSTQSTTSSEKSNRPRILGFVALGGEGKTSLLADWAVQMATQNWPGCAAVFAWSFYSQGTDQQIAASSELFLNSALIFFCDEKMAASAMNGEDKAKRLAALVGAQRSLLLLDGMEPLQYAPTSVLRGELRDKPMALLLKTLATQSQGLCVLTTRYEIADLQGLQGRGVQQHALLRLGQVPGWRCCAA